DKFDVIIIGTGMGGMACGAALAHYGRKVLLLEQHYIPGGFTHMFGRKGFHWDVGVHAIGEMREKDVPGRILNWLGRGEVEMVPLGNPYDRFWFADGYKWELPDSRVAYFAQLKAEFPEQEAALDKYFKLVGKAVKSAMSFFAMKSLPKTLDQLGTGLKNRLGTDWWGITTTDALDMAGIVGKLRTILTLHWGYYGSIPDESSFAIHALTHSHFWNGAYYPRGGSKSIAAALLGVVLDAGGEVLTRAAVAEVVLEGKVAVGVRMEDGRIFRAKKIISAAGAKTTVNELLPAPWKTSSWAAKIRALESSPPYICLNLGFHGDIRAAGASTANLWLMDSWDSNRLFWNLDEKDEQPHILYVSFPSLKDPDHQPGTQQKHTGEVVTFLPWKFFKHWEKTLQGDRGEAYLALKKRIEDRLLAILQKRIPAVMEHLVLHELSTPLSANYFTKAEKGAIYGLKASPARFTCSELRTRTPIKNFLMSGVDIASLGVVGAMTSGVLTATALDKRIYKHLL
ncbi:MAG TPA: NAD(P)/FAD-dependent oxidoreductase, partial [Bacteroidetes bacterium]|nr:NAD(P)/FAD-dependent oxidoreductase [Bacteroidota bacterium]